MINVRWIYFVFNSRFRCYFPIDHPIDAINRNLSPFEILSWNVSCHFNTLPVTWITSFFSMHRIPKKYTRFARFVSAIRSQSHITCTWQTKRNETPRNTIEETRTRVQRNSEDRVVLVRVSMSIGTWKLETGSWSLSLLHKTRVTRNSMFEKLFRERRIEGPRKSIDSYKFKNDSAAHARKKPSSFEITHTSFDFHS